MIHSDRVRIMPGDGAALFPADPIRARPTFDIPFGLAVGSLIVEDGNNGAVLHHS